MGVKISAEKQEDTIPNKIKIGKKIPFLIKFSEYRCYKWVYIAGALLILLNCLVIDSVHFMKICLFALYSILFYKSVEILQKYQKINKTAYKKIAKKEFSFKYSSFRLKVFLFWSAFIILCFIAKFWLKIDHNYFYSCTFFFLLLDRLFVNEGCLLRKFSDAKKTVICCCGCPCRGWDLLMINTPLMFALNNRYAFENIFIWISSILAVISFVSWEKRKYILVVVRKKCLKPCDLSLCRENLH